MSNTANAAPSGKENRLLNVHEIAVEIRADEKTVYRRIRDKKLKVFREGGRWFMWLSDLHTHLKKPSNEGQSL